MNFRLKELKSLLSIHLDDIRIVGIYGIGGIGKTTIAKMVYNDILHQFNGSSFLEDVKNRSNSHNDRLQLLQELLCGILADKNFKLNNISDGINMIKGRLGSKKVLVVIDDVDDLEQVKSLIGDCKWFGSGSRIIITTRNKGLLEGYGVHKLYEAKELCDEESIELFSWHAFKVKNIPKADYMNLSQRMVDYAQGLPLALKVLGSSLHNMKIDEWESKLDNLQKSSDKKINDVLRISVDGLVDSQKEVFLDIACFFKGEDKDFVSKILACDNLSTTYDIRVLHDRCLITIQDNMIQMHDLIQQMGWAIIREKYPKDRSKWSRLWDPNDIFIAFSGQKGMKNVESISLDLSRSKEIWFTTKVFAKMKEVFAKMTKLRLLKLYYSDRDNEYKTLLPKDFEFPPSLRYLHWEGLECLPSNFHGENLVAINLKSSNIKKLWKGNECLKILKFIDLSDSQQLTTMPKFSSMPNLERLNLRGCTSFQKFHSCIGVEMKFLRELCLSESGIKELPSGIRYLESLKILDLSWCSKFEKFPEIQGNMKCLKKVNLRYTAIKELPSSIGSLEALEHLYVSNCSNFEKFPEIQGNMKCLKWLFLGHTAIKELPNSIGSLRALKWLYLENTGIKELPNAIGCLEALEYLDVRNCSNFEKFPEIQGNMKCLERLHLGHTAIKELPNSIGSLRALKGLYLENTGIKELPNAIGCLEALEYLDVSNCSNFDKFPEIQGNMKCLKTLDLRNTAIKELPSSIRSLRALQTLNVSNCSNFEKFPEIQGNMKCLKELYLSNTGIKELPNAIGCLEALEHLDVSNCSNFEKFPEIQGNMKCLKELYLSNTAIKELPNSFGSLRALETLDVSQCSELEEIPELVPSLIFIYAHGCPHLESLSSPMHLFSSSFLNYFKSLNQDFRFSISREVFIPGSKGIPKWISHKSMGCELRIKLPKNWYEDNDLLGFALFVHYVLPDDDDNEYDGLQNSYHINLQLSISLGDHSVPEGRSMRFPFSRHDKSFPYYFQGRAPVLWVSYFPPSVISKEYRSSRWRVFKAHVSIKVDDPYNCTKKKVFEVKSCGIHPVYDGDHHQQI